MWQFEREVAEQPQVLRRLLADGRPAVEEAAARIRAAAPRLVVMAARGSSDNAARYGQYLFGVFHRWVVALAAPSLITLYRHAPDVRSALVVGISQSGHSPDIVAVVEEARHQGALTLAVTNDPASPLAQAADLVVPLLAGEERAVAATKTYTAQLMVLAMLSAALRNDEQAWEELSQVPAVVEACLTRNRGLAATAQTFAGTEHLVVVGRGFQYATAFEIALKVTEVCGIVASAYSSADFRHGPIALVRPGFPVFVVATSGAVLADVVDLVDTLRERGAELLIVSDDQALLERAAVPMPLPPGVPEWLAPLVAVVPGQLWTLALAEARGLDPDHPRGLTKVTRTL